jgi:UPF0716 family protein affecting phage T7 exclusion
MKDTGSDTPHNAHLGFRIAVGVAGLVLLVLVAMLGAVAMKQSATSQALEGQESLRKGAPSAPDRS